MFPATPTSTLRPPVARRVMLVTLAVMTVDQVGRAVALGWVEGNPSGAFAARTTHLGLGGSGLSLPMVALLAAVGIIAVGVVGLRRAQAGLLPAWVPGFLVGGGAAIVLDRFAGGGVADLLTAPWSFCTVADIAIVVATVGWVVVDRNQVRATGSTARGQLHA